MGRNLGGRGFILEGKKDLVKSQWDVFRESQEEITPSLFPGKEFSSPAAWSKGTRWRHGPRCTQLGKRSRKVQILLYLER
jgi:hypothetical protein